MTYDSRMCAYSAQKHCIIDIVHLTPEGYRSHCFGESLETMRKRYPDVELTHVEAASKRIDESFKSDPIEITEDRYHEMLEVLPPMHYRSDKGWTTFKMCELTCGNITAIFATNGNKYYELSDSQFLTHDQIIEKVTA